MHLLIISSASSTLKAMRSVSGTGTLPLQRDLLGIFVQRQVDRYMSDALMEKTGDDAHEAVDELVQVAEGQIRFIQLPLGVDSLHDLGDVRPDARGRGIHEGAARSLHGIGQHDDGGLLGLRTRPGVGVVLKAGILAHLQRLVVEEHGAARAVMLHDDVGDLAAEVVFRRKLGSLLDVGEENERAHGRRKLVVRIGSSELVFHEILRPGNLAYVVVERAHLAQQTVGAYGRGAGFHEIGHHKRVMIGAGHRHHEFLKQRMFQIHEFHHAEARGVAHEHFQHGAESEKQEQGACGIAEQRKQQKGELAPLEMAEQRRAQSRQQHPEKQRHAPPHHVLPVLRTEHQPGVGHGRHEVEEEQRNVAAENDRGEEGKHQPHGAVAARGKNERGKTGAAGHGKGKGQNVRHRSRSHRHENVHGTPGRQPEHHEQQRDEVLVLGAQHRALVAARRDEKTEQQEKAQHEAAAEDRPVHHAGRGAEQGLQLDLLFVRHRVAGADQHLSGLHLVEHRLNGGKHFLIALIRHFLIQGQRGQHHEGQHLLQHHLDAGIELFLGAELAPQGDLQRAQILQPAGLRAQNLRTAVQVAHDDGVVGIGQLTHVGDDAARKRGFHPRNERVQQIFLHVGGGKHPEGGRGHVGKMPLVEGAAHGFQTVVVESPAVDLVQQAEALRTKAFQRLLVDVENHGLKRQRTVAALLRGLRILHQKIPVGHHVLRGDLPGRIDHPGRPPRLHRAEQGDQHQRRRQG